MKATDPAEESELFRPARPIVLLDVDGVLNAVSGHNPSTWEEWRTNWANGFSIRWSPSMVAALRETCAPCELRWLTTWWDETEELSFLGVPELAVANTPEEYRRSAATWWKLPVAQRIYYQEERPLVWIDDELRSNHAAKEWIASLPEGHVLALSPETDKGLTPEHLAELETWLRRGLTES